jgi:hypothetical protein
MVNTMFMMLFVSGNLAKHELTCSLNLQTIGV